MVFSGPGQKKFPGPRGGPPPPPPVASGQMGDPHSSAGESCFIPSSLPVVCCGSLAWGNQTASRIVAGASNVRIRSSAPVFTRPTWRRHGVYRSADLRGRLPVLRSLGYDVVHFTDAIVLSFTFVEMTRPQITPTLKKTKLQKNEKQTPDLDQLLSVQSFKQVPGLATS